MATAEHRLSAWQPPLELSPLTPTALARMLQDSGIKWRVVVVSACYSGGFIEPLRDDNSIVITAAAADRTSFGCEAGRDFTYFGAGAGARRARAAPARSSRPSRSRAARCPKQEAAEGLPASLPQISVGPAIAELLKALDEPAQRPDDQRKQQRARERHVVHAPAHRHPEVAGKPQPRREYR